MKLVDIMMLQQGSRQGHNNSIKINNPARCCKGKVGKQTVPADLQARYSDYSNPI